MFDLSFRIWRTRIKVSIWFWVFAAFFGYIMGVHQLGGWPLFLVWIACEFVASVVKEIGHVLAGQYFGYPGTVVLGGMSGQAVGEYDRADRWKRIVIYLAGPFGALWFYFALYFATHPIMSRLAMFGRAEELVFWGIPFLSFLILFWSLFNLLPMLPTDGGIVMQNALGYIFGRRDFIAATVVSILVAFSLAGYSFYKRSHPELPFLGEIVRPLYHPDIRDNRFAKFDPDPLFFTLYFSYYGIINIVALFRKPKGSEPAVRVA